MKKIFYLAITILICILPSKIKATNVVTEVDGVVYVYEEQTPFICDLNPNAMKSGLAKDGNTMIYYGNRYYAVNFARECEKITEKQVFEMGLYESYKLGYDSATGDIYKRYTGTSTLPVLTTDTRPITGKRYYIVRESDMLWPIDNIDIFSNPSQLNYVEKITLEKPKANSFDDDKVYYAKTDDYYQIVSNPKIEDIWKYYVKFQKEVVANFNINTIEGANDLDISRLSENVFEYQGKIYMLLYDHDAEYHSNKNYIYNVDGKKATILNRHSLKDIKTSEEYTFISYYKNDTFVNEIYNINGSLLFDLAYFLDDDLPVADIIKDKGNMTYFNNHVYNVEAGIYERTMFSIAKYEEIGKGIKKFNNNDLIFKFSGDYSKLNSVKVNGLELEKTNYVIGNGSTIVTLKKDYLNNLSKGTYALKVAYNDGGYVNTSFIIPEIVPNTDDGVGGSFGIGVLCVIGIIGCIIYLKKKTNLRDN